VGPYKLTLFAFSFGSKVFLNSNVGVRFWFGLTQKNSICPCHLTIFLVILIVFMMQYFESLFSLCFTCNLMWYICVTPHPTKRKVMSSSHSMFLLLLCRSIMEFFYDFLGMFHIRFIHPSNNNKHTDLDTPLHILASHNLLGNRKNIHRWDYTWGIFKIRNLPQPIMPKILAHSCLHLSWAMLCPNVNNFVNKRLHNSSPHLDKVALHILVP
jgi:hypothetical protein